MTLPMGVVELEVGSQKIVPADGYLLRAPAKIENNVIESQNRCERLHRLPLKEVTKEDVFSRRACQHLSCQSRIQSGLGDTQIGGSCLRVLPCHTRVRIVLFGDVH